MIKYSENGFWIEQRDKQFVVGLAEKGQDDLGAVAFVELAQIDKLIADETFMSVEAAKAVTDLVAPLSGTVVLWHTQLEDQPQLLDETDRTKNWIVVLKDVDETQFDALASVPYPCEANK